MCTCNDVIHVMSHLPYTYVMQTYTRTQRINSFHRTQERTCVRKLCVRECIVNIHVHGTGERYQLANSVTTASEHVLWRDVLHSKSRRCQSSLKGVWCMWLLSEFYSGSVDNNETVAFRWTSCSSRVNWIQLDVAANRIYIVERCVIRNRCRCTLPAHHSSASSIQKLNHSRFLLNITKHTTLVIHLINFPFALLPNSLLCVDAVARMWGDGLFRTALGHCAVSRAYTSIYSHRYNERHHRRLYEVWACVSIRTHTHAGTRPSVARATVVCVYLRSVRKISWTKTTNVRKKIGKCSPLHAHRADGEKLYIRAHATL